MARQLLVFSNRMTMIDSLPDEDAGQLFKALLHYNEDGEMPVDLSQLADFSFTVIKDDIDRNVRYYEQISEKRREAGRKGGCKSGETRAKKANEANEANASSQANASFANENEANASFAWKNEANEPKHYTVNSKPQTPNTKHKTSDKADMERWLKDNGFNDMDMWLPIMERFVEVSDRYPVCAEELFVSE